MPLSFSAAILSSILKNVPTVLRFILWDLAKVTLSRSQTLNFSFMVEIIWNSNFYSRSVCSGKNSAPVCGKNRCSELSNMRDCFMRLSSFLETTTQSSWKIEQKNRSVSGLWNAYDIFFKIIWSYSSAASLPQHFAASLPISGRDDTPNHNCQTEWSTRLLRGVKSRSKNWKPVLYRDSKVKSMELINILRTGDADLRF